MSATFTTSSRDPDTPTTPLSVGRAAMIPATCVPCPSLSSKGLVSAVNDREVRIATASRSAGCVPSMPVSSTATRGPLVPVTGGVHPMVAR